MIAAALLLTVSLSDQFPDAATRSQGSVGACHAFTTVSLLEAAIWRRHALRLPLSESDLFVRKVVEDPAYFAKARAAVGTPDAAYKFVEGGSPLADIEFAKAHGVAKAATAPWSAFASRYAAWKAKKKKEVEDGREDVKTTAGALKGIGQDLDAVGEREAAGLSDRTAQISRTYLQRVQTKVGGAHLENVADFRAFLDEVAGKTKIEAESVLLGTSPLLAVDRSLVKTLAAPMRVRKLDYPYKRLPDAECRAAGAKQKAGLLLALDRKIPVSVTMDLDDLPEWGGERGGAAWHAFTITGYEKDDKGAVTLHSRNSWGGDNPAVPETRFCRINRVVAVLTDKE